MNKIKKEKKLTQVFLFGFLILFFSVLFFAPLNNTRVVYADDTLDELVDKANTWAVEATEAAAAATDYAGAAATIAEIDPSSSNVENAAKAKTAAVEATTAAAVATAKATEATAVAAAATTPADAQLVVDLVAEARDAAVVARDAAAAAAGAAGATSLPPLTVTLTPQSSASGPLTYSSLESIPGVDYSTPEKPGAYLASLIKVIIGIITALAVLIITIAGIEHIMGSGKEDARTAAKEKMYGALIGLIIALASYLILNTINPNLLNLDLSMPEINATAPAPPPTAYQTCMSKCLEKRRDDDLITATDDGIAQCQDPTECGPPPVAYGPPGGANNDAEIRAYLKKTAGITINKDNCAFYGATNCTSLDGLRENTIAGLLSLQAGLQTVCSGCVVNVTGGTEAGHSLGHSNGYKVDISLNPNIDAYITEHFTRAGTRSGPHGGPIYKDANGNEYVKESNHWDITFK